MININQYELTGNFGRVILLVPKYTGKYKDNPLVNMLSPDALSTQFTMAFERILARLGLPADGMILLIKFSDEKKAFASTDTVLDEQGVQIQQIEFSVKHFIRLYNFVTNIYEEIKHEAAHAVQRHWMQDNYESVPRWFREGCALYAAWPQGDVRVLAHYVLSAKNPDELITTLYAEPFNGRNYPEAYLAVKLITENWSPEILKQINKDLADNEFDIVFEHTLNITTERFDIAAQAYAFSEMHRHKFMRSIAQTARGR